MKTTTTKQQQTETVQPKANKQAGTQQILQRYKKQTAQLQAAEEEELLQGKFETAQRMGIEEEEPVQGKFATTQLAAEEHTVAAKPNNTGLPDNLKSGIENMSGYSMDDVKVHYNSSQPATLQAHAYAQGTDIHIAPGQEKHLPHEAWHVVQQKQGRVKPTMQMKGSVPVNDDAGLEKEADVMGVKALQLNRRDAQLNTEMNFEKPHNSSELTNINLELVAQRMFGSILTAVAAAALGYDYLKKWFLGDPNGEYKLSIMYFRDGKFTDAIGHVSVALQENNGTVIGLWGLSPQTLPENPIKELSRLISTPGRIYHDDSSLFPDHATSKETFNISGATASIVLNRILDDVENPPNYSILGYGGASCASWAITIAKVAGVSAGGFIDRYLIGIPRIMSLYSEELSREDQQNFQNFSNLQQTL